MAEAFAIAASAASFVGLAGQILSGCQYVSDFLDDVRDAPEDLKYFRNEVKIFQSALLVFQWSLQQIEQSARIEEVSAQAKSALESSEATVNDMREFIDQYTHKRKRDWWKDVKMAAKKSRFSIYIDRIERAKSNVLMAQASISMTLNKAQVNGVAEVNETLESLSEDISASTRIVTRVLDQVDEVQHTARETNDAILYMTASLSDKFNQLPLGMHAILKRTVNEALVEFFQEPCHTTRFEDVTGQAGVPKTPPLIAHEPENVSTIAPALTTGSLTRKFVGQRTYQQIVKRQFATLVIDSTTTTVQESVGEEDNDAFLTTTTTTKMKIDVRPNFWAIRFGLLAMIGRQHSGTFFPELDLGFRVYNIIPRDAPVARACYDGDIVTVCELMANGRASLYDRVEATGEPSVYGQGLLDIAWDSWYRQLLGLIYGDVGQGPSKGHLRMLHTQFQVFKFLVDRGLDPGEPGKWSGPRLHRLLYAARIGSDKLNAYIEEMARTIVFQSIRDPFLNVNLVEMEFYTSTHEVELPVHSLLRSQNQWAVEISTNRTKQTGSGFFRETIHSLLRDPDARGLGIWLKHNNCSSEWKVWHCLQAIRCAQSMLWTKKMEYAIQQRICLCLRMGMDPRDNWGSNSLSQTLRQMDKLDILQSTLIQTNWEPNDIAEFLEEDLYSSMAFQLASLESSQFQQFSYQLIPLSSWEDYIKRISSEAVSEEIEASDLIEEVVAGKEDNATVSNLAIPSEGQEYVSSVPDGMAIGLETFWT